MTKVMSTPFKGYLNNITEALILLEAARRGQVMIHTKRLTLTERMQIKSGTTFIVNETKTGIKRWSDGLSWNPSKLRKGFFIYFQCTKQSINTNNILRQKEGLLIKKAISITAPNNDHYHLVNCYRLSDLKDNKLMSPSQAKFSDLNGIMANISGYKFNTTFRNNKHKNLVKSEDSENKNSLSILPTNALQKEPLLKKDVRYLQRSTEDLRQLELLNKGFKNYLLLT